MSSESRLWATGKPLLRRFLGMRGVNDVLLTSLRHVPPSAWLARLPVSQSEVRATVRDLTFVLTHPHQCTIAREVYWGRGRRVAPDEQLSLELFRDLATDCGVILDIGANTGVFSLVGALANPRADVHAFEIVPEVFHVLVDNVLRNDLASHIDCHLRGIGEDHAVIRVPRVGAHDSLPMSLSSGTQSENGVAIAFTALDTFMNAIPDGRAGVLIKIDVEGTERAVFEGGWHTIDRFRPRIVCEILRSSTWAPSLGHALRERGYRLFNITHEGLVERVDLRPNPEHRDWLFTCDDASALRRKTTVAIQAA